MRIGVIVAMEKELSRLVTLLDDTRSERHGGRTFVRGTACGKEIVLQQCGIGKVNSAVGATEMINVYHPDMVISTGVAGGADISLNVCDTVVATECRYHDAYCGKECEYGQIIGMPASFVTDSRLVAAALSLHCSPRVRAGMIVSGDCFVDSRERMADILHRFPDALAVDMESCSIAQTCHIYGIPFVSFRIISDIPLKDDNASQYFDFWQRLADSSFDVTRKYLEEVNEE